MHIYILLIHILAATIWTGGHLVLVFTVLPRALAARDPAILLDFEQGFERLGIPALILQVTTGLWLAYLMVPNVAAWFAFEGSTENYIALKLGMLLMMAMLALNARFRVIPNLSAKSLPLMAWHIRVVTALSVGFVIAGVGLNMGGYS